MYFNEEITSAVHRLARCCRRKKTYMEVVLSERQPLLLQNGKEKYGGAQNGLIQPNGNVFETELTLKDCEELGKCRAKLRAALFFYKIKVSYANY